MGADGTVPAPGHYRPRSRVDHMDMHEVIRQRRSELGMSQANLATKVGVDRRQIRRYETGETQPTLSVAKAIARALGITIDELVGDETHRIDLTGDCVGVLAVLEGQRRGPQPPRGPPDPARRHVEIVAVTWATPLEGGGGYMWRGEMRLWDNEILMGWYTTYEGAVRPKGTLLLRAPPARHQRDQPMGGPQL